MRNPYLIQRSSIRRPLGDYRKERLGKSIQFDYMGSAEFEFGALPDALHRAQQTQKTAGFKLSKVESLKEGDKPLRVYHALSDEDFAKYVEWLESNREDEYRTRTKELTYFSVTMREESEYCQKIDFWWDIQNNVFWSFDKGFMKHLGVYLQSSWDYMNQPKEAA